jgi:uridylate kinase
MNRILIKLSGEALAHESGFGIDRETIARFANEIESYVKIGVQVAVVVGAGNILRGATVSAQGSDRVRGDHMGMLATAINGLAIKDVLLGLGIACEVLNAVEIPAIVAGFHRDRCDDLLKQGFVTVLTGGTGSPFFTTDSAAALRAAELGVDVLLKATKVDGIYDKDPKQYDDAKRFDSISYQEVLSRGLKVMDTSAVALCQENNIPIKVFDFTEPEQLRKLLSGEDGLGTLVFQES